MSDQTLLKRFFPNAVRGRHNVALLAAILMGFAFAFAFVISRNFHFGGPPYFMILLAVVPFCLSVLCVLIWFVLLLFFSMNYSLKNFMLVMLALGACLAVLIRAPQGYNVLGLVGIGMLALIVVINIAEKENNKLGRKL